MYYHNVKTNISGIIPNQVYNFFVEGLSSNWPVKAFPASGSLSSLTNVASITTSIYFCEELNCQNYLVYNSGTHELGSDPFANIRLRITSDALPSPIYTSATKVVCSGCASIPTISLADPWFSLEGTNQSTININFSGLKPHTTYSYQFKDIGTNYPVDLQLVSGTFSTQNNNTYSLRSNFAFCGYEDCEDVVIGSGFLNKIGTEQCDKYYTNLELLLNSAYLDNEIKSPKITIECDDCLPKPYITLPENFELDATTTNAFNLITSITGLKPNSKYDYSFQYVDGNHSVLLDNVSGYFYTDAAGTDLDLITSITVCESSGLCGNTNVLGAIQSTNCNKIKNTRLKLKLDSDCLDYSIYSSPVNISCDNCLPIPDIAVPSSRVSLGALGDEPNRYNLVSSITNLKSYSSYDYQIVDLKSNHLMGFESLSGTFSTQNETEYSLRNSVIFCESSGYCDDYATSGTVNSNRFSKVLNTSFRIKLSSTCLANPVYSDPVVIDCNYCLPYIDIDIPNEVTLTSTSGNIYSFNIPVSPLKPYSKYNYAIKNVNTNHLIGFKNLTGVIDTNINEVVTLSNDLVFCESSGYCNTYSTTGALNSNVCNNILRASFVLEIDNDDLHEPIVSQPIIAKCDNCITKLSIVTPSKTTLTTNNVHPIIIGLSNLKPYTEYTYSFKNVQSNHLIGLKELTGVLTTKSNTTTTLTNSLVFCESSGYCTTYYTTGTPNSNTCSNTLSASMKVELNSSCLSQPVLSDKIEVDCSDCIPMLTVNVPSKTTLTSNNTHSLNIGLSNLKPYTEYTYSFKNVQSNHLIGLKELTGVLTTKSNTTATLTNSLVFCESSGYCTTYYTTGTPNSNTCSNTLSASMKVELNSSCLSKPVLSDKIEVDCSDCIPMLAVNVPSKTTLTSNNTHSLNIGLSNLKPYTEYTYSFKNVESNHLIGLKELTGVITTKNNTTATLTNSLVFCESSGYCTTYYTTGTPNSNTCSNTLSASMKVELNSSCLSKPVLSDKIEVDCSDCIPKLTIGLPSNTNLTTTNMVSLTGVVTGLRPFLSYDYYFTGDNNWPILLDNVSGSFVPKTSSQNIVTKVLFCYPSGNCVGENGLLPYNLSSSVQKLLNNDILYGKLKLNIKSSSCNNTVYSSEVSNVTCKDCLPCVRYADVQISGSPVITLPDNCCNGQKLLSVNVVNAIPSEKYTYSFSSISGVGVNNLEFNPRTGEMYFGSGGAGTINSICAVDLVDFTQTLINFELTHSHTNFKVYDSIGLVCSTGSC